MQPQALALASLLCAACASEGGAFLPGDDPGTGTGTLKVTATALATPRFPNAGDGDAFDTAFRVKLERGTTRVTEGTVTVGSIAGTFLLTLDTREGGLWLGAQPGYHEIYTLDVASGADAIVDLRIDGPDLHTFSAPLPAATVDATVPLAVTWARVDTAPMAALATTLADDDVPDTGAFTLEAGALASAADRPVDEELRLDRTSAVVPAGAVTGSSWSMTVRNTVKIVVAATAPPKP